MVNQNKGIELRKSLYDALEPNGYFPALTGGLLYKQGERKDIDIVIYRHRQRHSDFDMPDIFDILEDCGLSDFECFGFVTKAKWGSVTVDLFNPEHTNDTHEYEG